MVSDIKGRGIANLRGEKSELYSELKESEGVANDQAFNLYYRLGEIEDELVELMRKRKAAPAVCDFILDHVNPLLRELRTEASPRKDWRALLNPKIDSRSEKTYLNIIAILHEVMAGKGGRLKAHPDYKDQAGLIGDMVEIYAESPGITDRTLGKVFAKARSSLNA
jgi:hypothetical protein